MKRTDFAELKNLDLKVLVTKIMQAKEELDGLVLDKNMKKLKDVNAVSKKKKDIAQMLTVVKQKKLIDQLVANESSLRAAAKQSSAPVKIATSDVRRTRNDVKKKRSKKT